MMIVIGYFHNFHQSKKEFTLTDEIVDDVNIFKTLLPPTTLILVVLGSIIAGIATPTEAAGVGAFGALIISALNGSLSLEL